MRFFICFFQIFLKVLESTVRQRTGWNKLTIKLAQIKKHMKMLQFYEVNFGIRVRQNIGQISSVKPKKIDMCRFVTMKAVHSTEKELHVINSLIIEFDAHVYFF